MGHDSVCGPECGEGVMEVVECPAGFSLFGSGAEVLLKALHYFRVVKGSGEGLLDESYAGLGSFRGGFFEKDGRWFGAGAIHMGKADLRMDFMK